MGAVQRLATVVIVGLVALATVLVLYVADESNRIDATALQQRDDGIARATTNFISLCMTCHGPAGLGVTGPDTKDANGNPTGRIGGVLGGVNASLNHTGSNDEGTPWPGQTELGVTYAGGFAGRTAWITNRITNGLLGSNGKYRMPPFSEEKGGPLNDAQIEELVWLIQYGDWNKVYNQAIATSGGYPTPPPAASTAAPTAAAAVNTPASGASGGGQAQAQLEMVDIGFSPKEITIPANTDATVTLNNTGATMHNFSVTDHNNPNVKNLGISVNVDAGQTQTVTINAPAGDYYFYCDVPGHEAAGMFGTLHVTAGAGGAGSAGASPAAGSSPAAGTPPPASGGAAQTVDLKMVDIDFDPKTLTIPANTDAVVHITNTGTTPHDFSIDELNISTGDIPAGSSMDVKINAPAGTYTYYCNVPGHRASGMEGTLTVK